MSKSTDIRSGRILKRIDLAKGVGLEIGPLTSPVVNKEDAADIRYLDHTNVVELKKKYKDEPVELEKIVPLDYALEGNSLEKVVKGQKFDYIIASHVIEHIPDIVSWLRELASVLKEGGIVSMAIPDKRYTFDINRRVSLPADAIGAYYDKLKRPTSAVVYDFAKECLKEVDSILAWNDPLKYSQGKKYWNDDEVREMCERNVRGEYVDSHCFVFTPASFVDILRELIEHGLFDFDVSYFLETQPGELEFYVSLIKTARNKKRQLKSLPNIREENLLQEIEKLNHRIESLRSEISAIKASSSWRITTPVRIVAKILKR